MPVDIKDEKRKVLPRWRKPSGLLSLNESSSSKIFNKEIDLSEHVQNINAWKTESGIEEATELLFSSVVFNKLESIAELEEVFLKGGIFVPESIKNLIRRYTIKSKEEDEVSDFIERIKKVHREQNTRRKIRYRKQLIQLYPRNPFTWLELSRLYLNVGLTNKAEKFLKVSLALAPHNRVIIRSASRFYVHDNKNRKARHVIRSTEKYKYDPWLLATDVSIGQLLNINDRSIKHAKSLIKKGEFSPKHLTELYSALATLEFENGNIKKAKKYISSSLESPNDNSLAQAEWFARQIPGLIIPEDFLAIPNAYEAKAQHLRGKSEWSDMLKTAESWCTDEPFSTRAPIDASYISCVALGDFNICRDFSDIGLLANPNDHILLNNYIVALAHTGELVKAENLLTERLAKVSKKDEVHFLALQGLINFKKGLFEDGRSYYIRSMDVAKELKDYRLLLLASLHYLQEELLANTNISNDIFDSVIPEARKTKDKEIQAMIERLSTLRRANETKI